METNSIVVSIEDESIGSKN